MTTLYLIRHSVRMPLNKIEKYNTTQDKLILNEKNSIKYWKKELNY